MANKMNQIPRKQTVYVKFTQLPVVMLSGGLNIDLANIKEINVTSQQELDSLLNSGSKFTQFCGHIISALISLSKRLNQHFNQTVISEINVLPFYDQEKRSIYLKVTYYDFTSDEFSEQFHHFIQTFLDAFTLQFTYLDGILKLKQHTVKHTFCNIDVIVKMFERNQNDIVNHIGGWRLTLGDDTDVIDSGFSIVNSTKRNVSLGHGTGIKLIFQAEAKYC